MKTGVVIGNVWATRKDEKLEGLKLMVIQPINIIDGSLIGEPIIAADMVGAGVTEKVIYVGGSSARVSINDTAVPVDATIVSIIDGYDVIKLEE